MTVTDRSSEPDAVFAARLETIEARQAVDIAGDVAEAELIDRVAQAIADSDDCDRADWPGMYEERAIAALAAMPPADEALRERVDRIEMMVERAESHGYDLDLDDVRAVLDGTS